MVYFGLENRKNMVRITILYQSNYNHSILIALKIIKEYCDLRLEEVAQLSEQFRLKNDIYFDVPQKNVDIVIRGISDIGFDCKICSE